MPGVFGDIGGRSWGAPRRWDRCQLSRGTQGFVPGRVKGTRQRGPALSGEGAARRGESTEGCLPPALPAPGPLNPPPTQRLPSLALSPGQGRRWPPGLSAAGLREQRAIPARLRCRSMRCECGRVPCCSFARGDATLKYFFPPLTGTVFLSFNALPLSPQDQEHIQIFTVYSDTSPRSTGLRSPTPRMFFGKKPKGQQRSGVMALPDSLPTHISSSGKGIWRKRSEVLQSTILQR